MDVNSQTGSRKTVQKIHAGWAPWTLGLILAIYKILYWQGIRKRISGGKISGKVLRKCAKQGAETFLTDHLLLTLADVNYKLKQATHNYKLIKKTSDR